MGHSTAVRIQFTIFVHREAEFGLTIREELIHKFCKSIEVNRLFDSTTGTICVNDSCVDGDAIIDSDRCARGESTISHQAKL